MAREIQLTSGSVLAGNPITFSIRPEYLSKKPSFHRVIVEVVCGMSGGDYETIKLSAPVAIEGDNVEIDISSALRVPLDSYEYSADDEVFPIVKWHIKAYDEYMDSNGDVYTRQGEVYFPAKPSEEDTDYRCMVGAFSDMERFISGQYKGVKNLTHKPIAVAQTVAVGESFTYAVPFAEEQYLASSVTLAQPTSKSTAIAKEGLQNIGGQKVFALPEARQKDRVVFRFVNSFGVIESVSVPKAYSKTLAITAEQYTVAKTETFNTFSRLMIKKSNNVESWLFTSDPLTEEWQQWYLHDFFMSEHIWMQVQGYWVPCNVVPEEKITFYDRTQRSMYSVSFTVKLGLNGSVKI